MKPNPSERIMARLCVLALMSGTSVGIWYFLPYFILDLGGGLIEVGLVSTIPGLVAALVQLSVGSVIDEVKATKGLLILGFVLSSVFAIPFLFASTPLTAILMAALMEAFNSMTIIWGVVNSIYMADLTPAKSRASIMSVYSSSWYLGNILGSFIAGYLASIDWRIVFLVLSVVNLVAGIFLKYFLPDGALKIKGTCYRAIIPPLLNVRKFLKIIASLPALIRESSREYASFCLALSVRSIGVSMVMPIVAFYLAEVLKASKPVIATLTSVGTLARIIPSPLVGRIADRWGRKKIFILGLVMMMVYPIVLVSTQDVGMLCSAYLMMGLGWTCNQATWLAWQMELIPPRRGLFMGLLNFLNNLSWAIGPSMGGLLGKYAGIWWGVGVTTLVEFMGFLLLMKVPEYASTIA